MQESSVALHPRVNNGKVSILRSLINVHVLFMSHFLVYARMLFSVTGFQLTVKTSPKHKGCWDDIRLSRQRALLTQSCFANAMLKYKEWRLYHLRLHEHLWLEHNNSLKWKAWRFSDDSSSQKVLKTCKKVNDVAWKKWGIWRLDSF